MEVVLVMFREGGEHRPFPINRPTTVVGRREDCDLRIAVGDVSRKHCKVYLKDDQLSVEDLGSSNGTYVNGERVQTSRLAAGDTVQIGPVIFVVQVDGAPEVAEARPMTRPKKQPSMVESEIDELDILNNDDSGAGADEVFDIDSNDSSRT